MKTYQLTKYPVGSIREMWSISWPLMLGLISTSLMIFTDRLLLSWYSPLALNACANATMAYYIFLVIPMSICAISEVLVGRLHGENSLNKIGGAVWQMVWFSLSLTPLFLAIAYGLPNLLFYKSQNLIFETAYFKVLMSFAPFFCVAIALNGFFIGVGKVRIVTLCTIIANLSNLALDYLLIFGWGPIESMGMTGAAIATGISQVIQTVVLLFFFLKKVHQSTYGSLNYFFNPFYFKEGIKIGAPSGSGHAIEIIAHYLFFRMVMMVGNDHMTIVALVQSFYILIGFVVEAQSKGISAIVANLLGAKEFGMIKTVFLSAIKLHTLFFLFFSGALYFFPDIILSLFLSEEHANLLNNASFSLMFYEATMWMSIFFLFDGFSWILIGLLTAAGDTKFIFYISSVVHWIVYVLPAFIFLGVWKNGANVAWMIIAIYSVIMCGFYLWRYSSKRWLTTYTESSKAEALALS